MTREMKTTVPIYTKDLDKVKEFKDKKKLQTLADAVRICVEFADSHGALS